MDKCFCHLNEYKVKDADARIEIENIKQELTNMGGTDLKDVGIYHIKLNFAVGDNKTLSSTNCEGYDELVARLKELHTLDNANKPLCVIAEFINYTLIFTGIKHIGFNLMLYSNMYINSSYEHHMQQMSVSTSSWSITISRYSYIPLVSGNVTAYTPSGDYNPATKKYVDDAIANVESSGGTGGVSEDTVNNLITNAISEEVTNRDNAISTAISELETGLSESEVNSLITSAINTEVTNRNTAINNANQKHIIRADLQSAVTLSSTDIVTLSLSETIKVGTKFSVSDGKVVIGSGVNHVMVSGNVYFEENIKVGDSLRAHIYKNDERVAKNWERYSEADGNENTGGYEDRGIIPTLISVVEGDVISLRGNNSTASTGKINTPSYLIVEYVD